MLWAAAHPVMTATQSGLGFLVSGSNAQLPSAPNRLPESLVERRAKSSGVDSEGLSQKQRQLMQQYFELVDWQGLKLPSAERRQRDSLKKNERSVEVWKDWIRLKKELATLGEELPPAELLPAKRKKQSPDPTK